jgi:hypothetical protein
MPLFLPALDPAIMESPIQNNNTELPTHSVAGSSQDPLEQIAEEIEPFEFASSLCLRKRLRDCQRALEKDQNRNQYLVFRNVPEIVFSALSSDACPESKVARLRYNPETGLLIVKVQPTPEHGIAAGSFNALITHEILTMEIMELLDPLGSATVSIGRWKMEADCCWALLGTSITWRSADSCGRYWVIEVGPETCRWRCRMVGDSGIDGSASNYH